MIHALLPDSEAAIIAQNLPELEILGTAASQRDEKLAQTIHHFFDLVRYEGVSPESTRFVGSAAVTLTQGLEAMRATKGLLALHAELILEDTKVVDLRTEPVWPEDIVGHINALPLGPHSAPDIAMQTSAFDSTQQWLEESRRMPLTIS